MLNLETAEATFDEPLTADKAINEILKVQGKTVDALALLGSLRTTDISHTHFGIHESLNELPEELRSPVRDEIETADETFYHRQSKIKLILSDYLGNLGLPCEAFTSLKGLEPPRLKAHFVPTGNWNPQTAIHVFPMLDFRARFEYSQEVQKAAENHSVHSTYQAPEPSIFYINTTRISGDERLYTVDLALGEGVTRNSRNIKTLIARQKPFGNLFKELGMKDRSEMMVVSFETQNLITALQTAVVK